MVIIKGGQRRGAEFRRVQHRSSELEGGTQLGSGGRGPWVAGLVGWTAGVLVVVLSGAECVLTAGWRIGLGGHGCAAIVDVLEYIV